MKKSIFLGIALLMVISIHAVSSLTEVTEDLGVDFSAGYEYWDRPPSCQGVEMYAVQNFTLLQAISPSLEPYPLDYSYVYDAEWNLLTSSDSCVFNTSHYICSYSENNSMSAGNTYFIMADSYDPMNITGWKVIATNGQNPTPITGTYLNVVNGAFYETFCMNETLDNSSKWHDEGELPTWSAFVLGVISDEYTPYGEDEQGPGKTRYILDENGNLIGVMQGNQVTYLEEQEEKAAPLSIIAPDTSGFIEQIKSWFKDQWDNLKSLFGG